MPVQPPQSSSSISWASPSISLRVEMLKWRSTSSVMYMYGMLLGLVTYKVLSLGHIGRAISRPDMSCEPLSPLTSALPGMRLPRTVRGTRISRPGTSLRLPMSTPKAAMIEAAAFMGRRVRVP